MNAMPVTLNGQLLPNGWKVISVKWLSRRYSGGTPDKNISYYWTEGTIPWLNSGSVNQGVIREPSEFITEEGFANSSAKWMPRGSLVMALAGQGKTKAMVGYLDIATTGNQSLAAIVPNAIDGKFLYWWLTSQYRHIRNLSSQDGRDGLNLEMVGSIRCPVPPLETQKRIAAFLDEKTAQIDGLIARKQALLARLAEKRQAIITQAVTKGLNPAAPLKDSGIDWLGQIPAHWEAVPLKRLKRFLTSGSRGWGDYYADEGDVFLRMTNVTKGGVEIDSTDLRHVKLDGVREGTRTATKVGDILITITAELGSVAIVRAAHAGAFINQHIALFRPDQSQCDPDFLVNFLWSDVTKAQFELSGQGGTKQGLGFDQVDNVMIALPPLDEQREITRQVESSRNNIDVAEGLVSQSVISLTEYRSALITSAVTGQLEI